MLCNKISNTFPSRYKTLTRALGWITIFSVVLSSLPIFQHEKVFNDSINNKDVFISFSIQNSVGLNINERDLRQKNSENINFSVNPIQGSLNSLIRLSDSYKIVSLVKLFGSILITSPNNHSFRGPPSKV